MKILFFLLQIAVLYLMTRGGIVLAFAGFSNKERSEAKGVLLRRLSKCSVISFIIFLSLGFFIIFIVDSQYIYNLVGNVPTIEDLHYGCMLRKEKQFRDRFFGGSHAIGSRGIIWLNEERIKWSSECYEEARQSKESFIQFQLKKKNARDRFNYLFERLKINWQSSALLLSLLIIVPVTLITSRDLKKLSIETDRQLVINNAFTHIYIGLLMQVFIQIFSFFSE